MSKSNFENLEVYQLSEDLADKVWEIVVVWESFPKNTVGHQLVRAADSIGANIAEGAGKGTLKTTGGLYVLPDLLLMKRNSGLTEPINEIC